MKIKDNGWKNHYKALKQLSSMKVQIGAIGDHGKISNADLIRVHEKGVPSMNIPARFAITRGLSENVPYLSKLTKNLLKANHSKKGFNIQAVGDGIGNAMTQIIKSTIKSRLEPALSEKYLERKVKEGFSDVPLVKTGQLINSIDYGVKR